MEETDSAILVTGIMEVSTRPRLHRREPEIHDPIMIILTNKAEEHYQIVLSSNWRAPPISISNKQK